MIFKLLNKQKKIKFEKKRNAELMVTQRVEAAYIRRKEEHVNLFLKKYFEFFCNLGQKRFVTQTKKRLE